MTDAGRWSADTDWRTTVGQMLVALLTLGTGRLAVGANFGFILYLTVWLPVLMVWWAGTFSRPKRWIVGGAIGVVTAGLLIAHWPLLVAIKLLALLGCFSFAGLGLALGLGRWIGPTLVAAVAIVLWLTWLTVPLLMTGPLLTLLSERTMTRLLAAHPVTACNVVDSTAGDWTHQAVAYTWLTKLGQDVPFDWPSTLLATAGLHLLVGVGGIAMQIVPRGTMSTSSLR